MKLEIDKKPPHSRMHFKQTDILPLHSLSEDVEMVSTR